MLVRRTAVALLLLSAGLLPACNKKESPDASATAAPAPTATVAETPTAPAAPRGPCKPQITRQPASQTITTGQSATLSVDANVPNNGTLAYRWYMIPSGAKGSTPIEKETSNAITVSPKVTTQYFAWIYTQCADKRDQKITDAAIVSVAR